jgi:hypothetical protein
MRSRQDMIADKNYYGRGFETTLTQAGVELLRPARKGEPARAGARFLLNGQKFHLVGPCSGLVRGLPRLDRMAPHGQGVGGECSPLQG